ncbi:MAG: CotH kinase family protein, partial [Fibromonadales bacterium]|nr:CotH kinase family protein [Fibromonadales bacterium]
MMCGAIKLAVTALAFLNVFSLAQTNNSFATIKITTKNNQEPTVSGSSELATMNYVSMTSFQLTDPTNSRNNLGPLTPEPQGETDSIRIRGNSTNSTNKKPYRIKLDKKQGLFGKPAAKSWVLLANFYDNSLMLNSIALRLGQKLGIAYTNTFQYVDLYINDKYKGIYLLTEQIQVGPNRIDIDEDLGWLVEFDYHKAAPDEIKFKPATNLTMYTRIRSPEVDCSNSVSSLPNCFSGSNENPTVSISQVKFVQDEVNAMFNALSAGNNSHRDLMDIDSWAKYVLIQQLMDNFDFNNKAMASGTAVNGSTIAEPASNYAYKDCGKRIHAGPLWDFDLAAGVGTNMYGTWPNTFSYYNEPIKPKHPFYQKLWDDPVFMAKFKKAWDNHQSDFNAISAFVDSLANVLAGRAVANFNAYSCGSMCGDKSSLTSEQAYRNKLNTLKTWWTNRMSFFSTEINKLNINTGNDITQTQPSGCQAP